MKRTLSNDDKEDANDQLSKKSRIDNHEQQSFDPKSEIENSVGITEYIALNQVKPFYGIQKRNPYDFLVNEVDMDGNVVELIDTSIPDDLKEGGKILTQEEKIEKQNEGYLTLKQDELISDEKLEQLKQFVDKLEEEKANMNEKSKSGKISMDDVPSFILDVETDKAKRSKTHEHMKTYFSHVLISDSTNTPQGTAVRARYNLGTDQLNNMLVKNAYNSKQAKKTKAKKRKAGTKKDQSSFFDPRNAAWPKDRPKYLQFTLAKQNMDTTNAMSQIARTIHVNSNVFTWAGTKDKRAITTQLVTAFKLPVEKLAVINNSRQGENIQVGQFKFVPNKLVLGQLKGNRFSLTIRRITQRDPSDTDADIQLALETIQDTGFINYFGMQRFGMEGNPTHKLGEGVLKNDWEKVVKSILTSRCAKNPGVKAVIDQFYIDGNAQAAMIKLKSGSAIEKALLSGYARSTVNDHSSAFGRLPRNLKTMYVHAYQSYVWNTMTSERIKKYGFKPVVGDLVYTDDKGDMDDAVDTENVETATITEEEQQPQESSASTESASTSDDVTSLSKQREVKILTEQDLDKYTIDQVILPLPGAYIKYPTNEINESFFFELMNKDGITQEHFSRYVEENGTYGAYRTIVAKAKDVKWNIIHHDQPEQKLMLTDFDKIKGITLDPFTGDKCRSLVISFTLPSSTYATMFIRELMKIPSIYSWNQTYNEQR
jgi:tRNA pseudouridine13 synthase